VANSDKFRVFYHDDPVSERTSGPGNKLSGFLAVLFLTAAGFYLQSTFAANITINSAVPLEFGQGISQTVSCSGNTALTITPYSSFVNETNGGGTHSLSSVKVSGIPTDCRGADFTLRAYGNSDSTPLSLFNTNSKTVTVQTFDTPGTSNDSGTAWAGAAGMSVSASDTGDAFTVTFTTPVASTYNVAKITLESSNADYSVGSPGGGGGTIFYVSTTGFNCGPLFTARCKYLEAAPNTWSGGVADIQKKWAITINQTASDISTIANDGSALPNNSSAGIGLGYFNSIAIVDQGNDNTTAAGAAREYAGGSKGDWYLPTSAELNQMCKWARGVAWTSDATICDGGILNSGPGAAGFVSSYYWSSSEKDGSNARNHLLSGAQGTGGGKNNNNYVRAIRAF
jgi:hypothetical protein